jgi:hypothetical protein
VLALLDLSNLFGLPAHPLLVHVPIVLVPLAALGALAALLRPSWRPWCLPLTAALAGVATAGVQLAMGSGEELEHLERGPLVARHAHLAEQARPMVAVFFLAAVAAAVVAWWLERAHRPSDGPGAARRHRRSGLAALLVPLCVLSVATGALATTWIVKTGHAGARSVWQEGSGGERPPLLDGRP